MPEEFSAKGFINKQLTIFNLKKELKEVRDKITDVTIEKGYFPLNFSIDNGKPLVMRAKEITAEMRLLQITEIIKNPQQR